MLSKKDKIEIRKIELESKKIEIHEFQIKLGLDIMKFLDKDKYLNWSSSAQQKFMKKY